MLWLEERKMQYHFTDYCLCPGCRSELRESEGTLRCTRCEACYDILDGIPMFLPDYQDEERKRYLESYKEIAKDDLQVPLEPYRKPLHRGLIDFIGNVKNKKVLDIGSSHAMYLRELNAGFKVAFDLAESYLRAIPKSDSIVPICGDAEDLPFKPDFFDVIIISDVLEHLLNPESLIQHLRGICGRQTRLIIHIPWEESLEPYVRCKYEFAHLRNFNAYKFAQLMQGFYVKRERATFPLLDEPLLFKLHRKIPRRLYNLLSFIHLESKAYQWENECWPRWMNEFPKREWWLLWFYKPICRMFELRSAKRSVYSVVYRVMRVLQAILARFGQEGKIRGVPR